MDNGSAFSALLKEHRRAAGLTQEALAERATLSARTISDLERGVSSAPRPITIALLSEALQLTPVQRLMLTNAARARAAVPVVSLHPVNFLGALPAQLTSFVGRAEELHALRALLGRDGCRLVTLTGPGGVGKTRLAVEAAAGTADRFPDGVTFVALAGSAHRDDAVRAILRALGAPDPAVDAAVPALIEQLAGNELLLVLDNLEHLPDLAPLLSELLQRCTALTLLATGRAPLHLSGEHLMLVAPLAVPDPAGRQPADAIAGYASVALFAERAAQVKPDFALTEANLPTVAAICERLDGLPLAIELAAARARLLSLPAILARLTGEPSGTSLQLLDGGARDWPARHHSLRGTLTWSYELLNPAEQQVFRELAVFTGACTLEAATVVCRPAGEDPDAMAAAEDATLERLASLVDMNLITCTTGPDDEPRFGMLETIRGFALERLSACGEEDAVRRRHAQYYLALVEATGALLFAPALVRMRIATEQDDIQAALRWFVQHG